MNPVLERVVQLLGSPLAAAHPARGGCVAEAWLVELEDGRYVFAKSMPDHSSPFLAEAACLQALRVPGGVRVPEVWHVEAGLLVLEGIRAGTPGTAFMETLGRQLACTHRCQHEAYGFDMDHCIGSTPQRNLPRVPATPGAWPGYWWHYRLEPMYRHVERLGGIDHDLRQRFLRLEGRVEGLLAGSGDEASLLHGDLWSGNLMAGPGGEPVYFDPASYYGHRECDLAMTRLFGGFSEAFYAAYHEAFPLVDGWRDRLEFYMLYHVLNHIPSYGQSYAAQACRLMDQCLGRLRAATPRVPPVRAVR